jgi:hypothetical protein
MTGLGARFATILVLALPALAATASSGAARSPAHAKILGAVPRTGQLLSQALRPAAPTTLTFDASYQTLINRYLADVAAASAVHATDNVYSTDTQYFSNPGAVHILYASTFGGSFVDHDPLPANGCDDGVDSFCLTDQQLQGEIQNALTAKGWHGSPTNMFFLMTPNGVGSCEFAGPASNANPCSTNFFCAYHSDFVNGSGEDVIYANEPYEGPAPDCSDPLNQGFPNDVDADTTINTISHEHNEAITDPLGSAWFADDGAGNENGDLCAFSFGTPISGTPGIDAYNQVINGHHYDLQEEFSNADRTNPNNGCVLSAGGTSDPPTSGTGKALVYHNGPVMHTNTTYAIYWLPVAGNASPPVVTGTAAVNQTLTTSAGSWSGAPSGFSHQWQRCSTSGANCVNISGATAATYKLTSADGLHTVRSTIQATNVNGTSAPTASTATAVVIAVPAVTKAPRISGRARVGKRLSASRGSWIGPPTAYRFQWLRCNARGGRCKRIGGATRTRYRLTKRDGKHRLRVRVTALDVAGSGTSTSATSRRVAATR